MIDNKHCTMSNMDCEVEPPPFQLKVGFITLVWGLVGVLGVVFGYIHWLLEREKLIGSNAVGKNKCERN